jgi:hypothetical protein
MEPPPLTVTRRIKRIAPLQLGKILACLYGAMGLIFVPLFVITSVIVSHLPNARGGLPFFVGIGFAIAAPVFYAVMGFLAGVISAAIYNLIAKWLGGIEVEVE